MFGDERLHVCSSHLGQHESHKNLHVAWLAWHAGATKHSRNLACGGRASAGNVQGVVLVIHESFLGIKLAEAMNTLPIP